MTFSLSTVIGCEVGMAWRINFWDVVADAGSVLAITVVRGTVWSVTVCNCWFPGETTTGTWAGVCKVLLKLENRKMLECSQVYYSMSVLQHRVLKLLIWRGKARRTTVLPATENWT